MLERRWAVVDKDGLVVNVVVWDGETEWAPPKEHVLRELNPDEAPALLVDTYDPKTDAFTQQIPNAPVTAILPASPLEAVKAMVAKMVDLQVLSDADAKAILESETILIDGVPVAKQ